MAGNQAESLGDDFLEQMLAPPYGGPGGDVGGPMPMALQLGSGGPTAAGGGFRMGMGMPLGLNLEQGFLRHHEHEHDNHRFREDQQHQHQHQHQQQHHHHHLHVLEPLNNNNNNNTTTSGGNNNNAMNERDSVHMGNLFPAFGHLQSQSLRAPPPQLHQPFHVQATTCPVAAPPQPPSIRPRVRARRGQATDPHSIAERLRRERIAERMKALQELVPSCNKTDRAAMLDEIVDYVKFLRLQVKVLSMSRLGGAGAVAQLVADVPLSSIEGDGIEGGNGQAAWDKWSTDGTEQQVAKLMEEDVGAAMQFLQSKALCIMPISLASAIFRTHQPDAPTMVKPESNNSS